MMPGIHYYIDENTGQTVWVDENGQPIPALLPDTGGTPLPKVPSYPHPTAPSPPAPEGGFIGPPLPSDPNVQQGPPMPQNLVARGKVQSELASAQERYNLAKGFLDAAQQEGFDYDGRYGPIAQLASNERALWNDVEQAQKKLDAVVSPQRPPGQVLKDDAGNTWNIWQDPATGELKKEMIFPAAPGSSAAARPSYQQPDTTSPYIASMMPDGTVNWIPNQNYDPSQQNAQQMNAQTNAAQLEWQKQYQQGLLNQQAGQDAWQQQYQQQQLDRQAREDAWAQAQAQMQARQSAFNTLSNTFTQLAPRMVPPGQQFWAGMEPGSAMQSIFSNRGLPWNPESYKLRTVPWDPSALWQQAQDMIGAQQPGG